jgi:hypothetical protein
MDRDGAMHTFRNPIRETRTPDFSPEAVPEHEPRSASSADLVEAFRSALLDYYRDAPPAQMEGILSGMLGMMTAEQGAAFVEGLRGGRLDEQVFPVRAPRPVRPARPPRQRSWASYLPFGEGIPLSVAYESWAGRWEIGQATVLDRTPGLLRLQIQLKGWELVGVPETDALLAVEYRREGRGNQAEVVVNGQRYVDEDVFIRSGRGARELRIPIHVLGMSVDRITLIRQGPGEALVTLRAGEVEHVLVLTAAAPWAMPDEVG